MLGTVEVVEVPAKAVPIVGISSEGRSLKTLGKEKGAGGGGGGKKLGNPGLNPPNPFPWE